MVMATPWELVYSYAQNRPVFHFKASLGNTAIWHPVRHIDTLLPKA